MCLFAIIFTLAAVIIAGITDSEAPKGFIVIVSIIFLSFGYYILSSGARNRRRYEKALIKLKALRERYGAAEKLDIECFGIQRKINKKKKKLEDLDKKVAEAESKINIYTDDLEAIDVGVFPSTFELDASEDYKNAIIEAKKNQKDMIKNKIACICTTEWTVDGSIRKGKAMTAQQIKMALRGFNSECDAMVSAVKWNNYWKMVERMEKSFHLINRFNEKNTISITEDYFNLKIDELHNTYKYRLKKHQEQEEQREIRTQIREEERARREIEKTLREAEKEEKIIQAALAKAKSELETATAEQKHKYESQLRALEEKLAEAEAKGERALSMAQQTKRGHIYIISNIGSFGEQVFKIGMTRRLEPFDRVKELGDASVPFPFDVHAMIFSEDAPKLEKELHRHFELASVNKVNNRKEFFKLNLKEIRDYLNKEDIDVRWTMTAEATEYRQSLVILEQQAKSAA